MAMIEREALFTDETAGFRRPVNPKAGDEVIFRFRARKNNVEHVYLNSRSVRRELIRKDTDGIFDYYETSAVIGEGRFRYFFEVTSGEEHLYYSRTGVGAGRPHPENSFAVLPGFDVPEWAKGAVMYQIFTDRFRKGNPDSGVLTGEYAYIGRQVTRVENWNAIPEAFDVTRFYGGDLPGVMEKLDYLAHLGIEAIYFNPLFVSASNHKYDSMDYEHIDPHLVGFVKDEGKLLEPGCLDNRQATRFITRVTDQENLDYADAYFAHLVEEAHKRGIRVIIDGVFNHCGSFHPWMDRERVYEMARGKAVGAYQEKDSPFHDYFMFEDSGSWPYNDRYLAWWGHDTLPKLYYENSEELTEYILRVARKWLLPPYNADGWRLDVAADLGQSPEYNHEFWQAFRKAVKEVRPDAVIYAEHYGNPELWLRGNEWDSVMNYDAFMDPVGYFLTGMEKHSDAFEPSLQGNGQQFFEYLERNMASFPTPSLQMAMNQLSNHDHSRFLTRTNSRVGRIADAGAEAASQNVSYEAYKAGVVIQFTLPGAPTIYYGDETGVCGWTDPDSRRTYPWGRENWMLIAFHRDMIRIHKAYSCLRTGSYKSLSGEEGFIAYGRFDDRSSVLVMVNQTYFERKTMLDVSLINMPENGPVYRVLQTDEAGYNVGVKKAETIHGRLSVTVPAFSTVIYACTETDR